MKRRQIDLFFEELDRRLKTPAQIILVGASAGTLMGHIRPSVDIEFEIRPKRRANASQKELIQNQIRETSLKFGIAVNFSDDISRWSMINYLDYRKTASRYKKIGLLDIKLISPEYWTIGKMTRFLELDIQDMAKIIKSKKIPARRMIRVWARALKSSDLSVEAGQFRRHVEFFVTHYGRRLWGKGFDAGSSTVYFHKLAGIR